jgi:hypothetical protein
MQLTDRPASRILGGLQLSRVFNGIALACCPAKEVIAGTLVGEVSTEPP